MLTLDGLNDRRELIDASADLSALRTHLIARAEPLLARMPTVPVVKALLSRDGGVCPDDGSQLDFDPWSPDAHRCPRCHQIFSGSRHHAHWARAQHLWIAERAAHLATLHATGTVDGAGARARDLLAAYYELYFALPNSDNILGPSHLFFSTYLESIWILDYLSAAFILRECDALDASDIEQIDAIADEAATLIAEFNEGMSNRQTWNSAALTAIATWFGDEELAETAIQGRTGLLGHLADGFGSDGMWHEGDNYHLFALRGLLVGLQWSATAGADLLADPAVAAHLGHALMAPAATALPDLTFPARKDARYGVSLAHPAYLEEWEFGLHTLGSQAPAALASWLHALYAVPPRAEQTYDSYLHDAGFDLPVERSRTGLSWWSLLTMSATLPDAPQWTPQSRLLDQQGLGVMRRDDSYVSLECGGSSGGHGHPDALSLTLFADGVHWLPDPGTGSYVTRDLFWYRSTLAHNAPRLNGVDQAPGVPARCAAWQTDAEWSWCSGTWNTVRRAVIAGPRWIVDVVERDGPDAATLDVPWHLNGDLRFSERGSWAEHDSISEFVGEVSRLVATDEQFPLVTARHGERTLAVWFAGDGELLRATGPGLPGTADEQEFVIRRFTAMKGTMISVIDSGATVTSIAWNGGTIEVREGDALTTVQVGAAEATIASAGKSTGLAGLRPAPLRLSSLFEERPPATIGQATWIDTAPALDGTLDGFRELRPLTIDEEYQYFRSEVSYPGPEDFSATAFVNWSRDDLFLAVEVTKQDLVIRRDDALPLALDNEADDINADGVQVYYRPADEQHYAWLIRPGDDGALRIRPIGPAVDQRAPEGGWQRTQRGYRITVRLPCPHLDTLRRADRIDFDLIVNEMHPTRTRRAGQLVWSGGPGWVYLRGDRHHPAQFGELELIG